ncbi:tail length tape measure protein [Clostridium saccharoperbutylacetonicum]|uniref:tail length tape measure protein n=1 Tax=Clostridium saccharoperbutylacetonicum TaxID=36745 RepID=UPI0039E84ECB
MALISMAAVSMTSNLTVNIGLMDNFNNKVDQLISGVDKLNNSFSRIEGTLKEMCGLQSELLNKESSTTNIISQEISLTNVLNQSMQNVVNVQEEAKESAKESGGIFEKAFNIAKNGIQTTITEAIKMKDQIISVQGMLGDKGAGKAYFNQLQKDANKSGFAFQDLQDNARNFIGITKNTESLDKLNNLSERLSIGNTSKGLGDAGSAIKDMMSGEGDSLKTDFGFNDDDIGILKASKDMDDFTGKFDELLNKKGLDSDMLNTFNSSPTAQLDNLKSNLDTGLGQAGQGLLEALTPVIVAINQMFSDGSFQVFIDMISNGLNWIVGLIEWLSQAVVSGLPIIIPVIAGIITMLAIWQASLLSVAIYQGIVNFVEGIYAIMTGNATIAQLGLNAAMYACPAVWIIGIILAVIVAFAALVACCEPVRLGFSAAFQGIAMVCSSVFGFVIDIIQNSLNWMINNINKVLDKINMVSKMASTVFGGDGLNIHMENVDFSGFKNTWQDRINNSGDSGANAIKNFNVDNIIASVKGYIPSGNSNNSDNDIINNFNKKQGKGDLPMNSLGDSGLTSNNLGNNSALTDNSAKCADSLKNMDNSIDISNEHLEMLRDLAEQDSIQNFVTLTPTVQITTGDIKEEADINKIISHIENYMENELANSAEGVYA